MAKIKIERPSPDQVAGLDLDSWSPWECEPSTFDWHYDADETAYVLEGRVKVKTAWEEVEIRKGDLVTFPAGLSCTWTVLEKIRKVYTFD